MLLQLVIEFAKKNPWLVTLNMLMMIFSPINEVLLPYVYGKMINNIMNDKAFMTLGVVALVLLIAQIGQLTRDKVNEKFIPRLESFIKAELLDIILKNHNTSFDELTTGEIIYKMTKVPDIIVYWFQCMNDYIIPYLFVFVTAIFYFASFDKAIVIGFIVFLIIMIGVFVYTPKACMAPSKKNDDVFTKLHEMVEDIIHNMPSVYTSNSRKYELNRIYEQAKRYTQNFAATATCARKFKATMLPVITILVVFFVVRSMHLLKQKNVSKERFVSMFVVLTSMISSIFWVVDIMRYSVLDLGCMSNMDEMLMPPLNTSRQGMSRPAPKNIIGLTNVTFSYGTKKVLDNVSIDFPEGKTSVLLGEVGAGKTTILKLLLGFYVPQSGDAYIDGKWYRDLKIEDVRSKIGYVPQNPVLFNNTVLYNMTYGNGADPATVAQLLKSLGMDVGFLNKHVGKNGMHLSGGQRQLVWCIRVLLKNPKILIMDEPTASMDRVTKDSLLKLLTTIMKGRTVIMVTHDPYLASHAENKINIS